MLTDTINFLQDCEEQSLLLSPDTLEVNQHFKPFYSQLISAIEIFNTLQLSLEIKTIKEKSIQEQNLIQESRTELQSLTQQLLKEKEETTELRIELETIECQLQSAEREHQQFVKDLEIRQLEAQQKLEKYQEMELAQVQSVAAIMNARAKAELELDEVSFRHQTELQRVTDIFLLKNPTRSPTAIHAPGITTTAATKAPISAPKREVEIVNESGARSRPIPTHKLRRGSYDQNETSSLLQRMKLLLAKPSPASDGAPLEPSADQPSTIKSDSDRRSSASPHQSRQNSLSSESQSHQRVPPILFSPLLLPPSGMGNISFESLPPPPLPPSPPSPPPSFVEDFDFCPPVPLNSLAPESTPEVPSADQESGLSAVDKDTMEMFPPPPLPSPPPLHSRGNR
jgi:hypothetical protein